MRNLFKGVPSRDEIISLPKNERVCDECGAAFEPIGKEFVRHEFRFTPAKGEVVNIYRETYKCPALVVFMHNNINLFLRIMLKAEFEHDIVKK